MVSDGQGTLPGDARALYLTIPEAARTARVASRTLRRWIADGQLEGVRALRVGRVLRIDGASWKLWIDRHLGPASPRAERTTAWG